MARSLPGGQPLMMLNRVDGLMSSMHKIPTGLI